MTETGPCIRCGRCVEVCPSNLIPQQMMIYAERFDDANFEAINGMECYECGCCTYVCPAGRPNVQHFRRAKAEINEKRRKNK